VKFCLVFHREAVSVPVMRRVLGDTLRGVGVDEESVSDILLAATEACTNVLMHGDRHVQGYAVLTSVGAARCQVEVAGEGAGAVPQGPQGPGRHEAGWYEPGGRGSAEAQVPPGPDGSRPQTDIAQLPESGRGLAVMRACVDTVTLASSPERGTVVTMSKHIRLARDERGRRWPEARRAGLSHPGWVRPVRWPGLGSDHELGPKLGG
jgi:serine/threonine-protein kinase RsbW